MSAFVVDDSTINRIVAGLLAAMNDTRYHYPTVPEPLKAELSQPAYFGRRLFDLNCDAVDQRYGSGQAEQFRDLNYEYRPMVPPTRHQLVKDIDCWSYQCCEGDVPETSELYKIMELFNLRLCHRIVTDSDMYDKAKWGDFTPDSAPAELSFDPPQSTPAAKPEPLHLTAYDVKPQPEPEPKPEPKPYVHKDIKTIAAEARQKLAAEFPACKFSVRIQRYSGGQSMTVALMSAPASPFAKPEDYPDAYAQLSEYVIKNSDGEWAANGCTLTPKAAAMFKRVIEIANTHNWDRSDIQSDYFDVNFYLHLEIGNWNKPFTVK